MDTTPPPHPLVLPRTVRWGDCDPAGILYTPRVFDYMAEAVETWFRDVAGVAWMTLIRDGRHGAPTVHTACDYRRPMGPDLRIALTVELERIGRSSLSFRIVGDDDDGQRYFEGRLVSCLTDLKAGRPVPIPDTIRSRAEAYQAAAG